MSKKVKVRARITEIITFLTLVLPGSRTISHLSAKIYPCELVLFHLVCFAFRSGAQPSGFVVLVQGPSINVGLHQSNEMSQHILGLMT